MGRLPVTIEARLSPRTATATIRRQILIVNDTPGLSLVLARAVTRCGYDVFLAPTSADAHTQLRAHPHLDAVIADLTAPDTRGIALVAAILRSHHAIPILFLTDGPPMPGPRDNPLVALLSTPVSTEALHHTLEDLMSSTPAPPT